MAATIKKATAHILRAISRKVYEFEKTDTWGGGEVLQVNEPLEPQIMSHLCQIVSDDFGLCLVSYKTLP